MKVIIAVEHARRHMRALVFRSPGKTISDKVSEPQTAITFPLGSPQITNDDFAAVVTTLTANGVDVALTLRTFGLIVQVANMGAPEQFKVTCPENPLTPLS